MQDESLFNDLMYILRRAARGSHIEFRNNGRHHVAPFEEMFVKGKNKVIITHPEVYVDYGDGQYVEMLENEPTSHIVDLDNSGFCWIGTPDFRDGHVCIIGVDGPFHVFFHSNAKAA